MTASDDGQAGVMASQLAILMPVLLLLVMLAVQFALWAHASQLAAAAADAAVTAAALPDGTAQDGQVAAAGLLAQAGNLSEVSITVDRTSGQATAAVSGLAPHLVPGWRWSVAAEAAAALEVFTPEGRR